MDIDQEDDQTEYPETQVIYADTIQVTQQITQQPISVPSQSPLIQQRVDLKFFGNLKDVQIPIQSNQDIPSTQHTISKTPMMTLKNHFTALNYNLIRINPNTNDHTLQGRWKKDGVFQIEPYHKGQVLIGRSEKAIIQLNDKTISKDHCKIEDRNGDYYLVKLTSTSSVIKYRYPGETEVRTGDTLIVQDQQWRVDIQILDNNRMEFKIDQVAVIMENGTHITFTGEAIDRNEKKGIYYLPKAKKNHFSIINSCGVAILKENQKSGVRDKVWFLLRKEVKLKPTIQFGLGNLEFLWSQ